MVLHCACVSGTEENLHLVWLDSSWASKTQDFACFIFKHLAKLPSRESG